MTARSTLIVAVETLLGIGPFKSSINMQAAKIYYRIENTQEVKIIREGESRELINEGVLEMASDKIAKIHFLAKNYRISLPSRKD